MATTVGTDNFVYMVAEGWGNLPEGWTYKEVAGVGVDSRDNVYVFNRGEHPMIVFDREGNFLRSWGEDVFLRAHGVTMGADDTIYCTDDEDHTVRKCTLDGQVLLTLGNSGQPSPFMSGLPFNRSTHVALDPDTNDIYVSDGYSNARVHKYSPDGALLFSWGEPGTDPGQFNIVHNVCTDKDGFVYVADRENHRIQVFDSKGRFQTQWVNLARPCGMYIDQTKEICYVGELGAAISTNEGAPGLGPRISILNLKGEVLSRLGDVGPGEAVGQFIAPHGVTIDSRGDLYVAEASWVTMGRLLDLPREMRSFQKLIREASI